MTIRLNVRWTRPCKSAGPNILTRCSGAERREFLNGPGTQTFRRLRYVAALGTLIETFVFFIFLQ